MELCKPVLAVAQQEVDYLVLAVVEAEAVPGRMLMTVARIEILVRIAGKITKAFQLVLHCMRVDDVHDDGNTVLMGSINEILQLFWSTETAAGCKEAAHMITERTIIWMFLDSHDLDAVVTVLDDARQYILLELSIGSNLLCILAHTDMALINQERSGLSLESLLLPLVRLWIPNLRRENLGLLILYYALSPCRDSLAFATFPVHLHLIEVTVLQCLLRKLQLPVA